MAGPSQVPLPILRVAISVILVLALSLPPCATHTARNVLISGETLGAGAGLAYRNHSFVMGADCNLLLDQGVWQSATAGGGSGCRLTLEGDGRLVVRAEDGATVWTSLAESNHRGEYAAVLTPKGRLTVYGPAVRSDAGHSGHQLLHRLGCLNGGNWDNCIIMRDDELLRSPFSLPRRDFHRHTVQKLNCLHLGKWDNCIINGAAPTADNVLFSGTRRLALGGSFRGVRCFLRLNDRGELAIVDDNEGIIWSNNVRSNKGDYVAVLRQDGEVTVYGPAIWSAAGGRAEQHHEVISSVSRKIGNVKMVTDRE